MNKKELLLPNLPSEQNEQEQLYEEASPTPTARRIYLAMTLLDQNDALLAKINQLRKLVQEEDLKAKIFREKITRNEQTMNRLKKRKEQLCESQRMATLNESSIPNKSVELASTLNTNSWAHELLGKEEMDSLWSEKKQKSKPNERTEPKVKSYTIDISSLIPPKTATARNSIREQTIDNYINQKEEIQQKLLSRREAAKEGGKAKCAPRVSIKLDVGEKQRQLNKTLSQMRNLKRAKNNPES